MRENPRKRDSSIECDRPPATSASNPPTWDNPRKARALHASIGNPQRLYVQTCPMQLEAQWVVGFVDGEIFIPSTHTEYQSVSVFRIHRCATEPTSRFFMPEGLLRLRRGSQKPRDAWPPVPQQGNTCCRSRAVLHEPLVEARKRGIS